MDGLIIIFSITALYMLLQENIQALSFKHWLRKDKENRTLLRLSTMAVILQFAVFKFFYPFPNFMPPDSTSYIEAAYYNQSINMWAIGYSKFLRLVSSFSNSHWVLVWIQYLSLQTCLLYFLYTVRYLMMPGKWVFRILIACSILNPLLPHISNFVSSDAVFTALSLLWFAQLLWILHKPSGKLLFFHAVVLLFAFMVRYNALFYPVVSIIFIFFSAANMKRKLQCIGLIVFLVGGFVGRTQYKYYVNTGTVQYSAFGGWQMAANALYGYAFATPDAPVDVPIEFRQLHMLVNQHMDSLRHLQPIQRPDNEVGIYYLWDEKAPLKVYLNARTGRDTSKPFFLRWASMGPLYAAYGRYLIQQHPWLYVRYYVWPNLIKYYAPPTKFMGVYNLEDKSVDPVVGQWFGWADNNISPRYNNAKIAIAEYFTVLMAVINLVFLLSLIAFSSLSGFKRSTPYSKRALICMFTIWITNMAFSVLSAPIELRYQLFPMVITFVFAILVVECIIREVGSAEANEYSALIQ